MSEDRLTREVLIAARDAVLVDEYGVASFTVSAMTKAFIETSTSRRDLREFLAKWWPTSTTTLRRQFIDAWIEQHGEPAGWRGQRQVSGDE